MDRRHKSVSGRLAYIAETLESLKAMAVQDGKSTLAYFIDMAHIEAMDQIAAVLNGEPKPHP